jgi:hypothetical protein
MRNLGNTCFAAAAVRALGSCPAFARAIYSSPKQSSLGKKLVELMLDPTSSAWPSFVVEAGRLIGRNGSEPHDSHELICALIEHTKTERCFRVNNVTAITCGSCGNTETKREKHTYVSSEPSSSLVEGIAATYVVKTVGDRQCDECRKKCTAHLKTMSRKPAPVVLIVRVTGSSLWAENEFVFCGARYALRAAIVYRGDGRCGHYACALRSVEGSWTMCDDDSVSDASFRSKNGATRIDNPNTFVYEACFS